MRRVCAGLRARRHTVLLTALIAAYAVRPLIADERAALGAFSAAIIVLMMLLYAMQIDDAAEGGGRGGVRAWQAVAWGLATLAIVERVVTLSDPSRLLSDVEVLSWLSSCSGVCCAARSAGAR